MRLLLLLIAISMLSCSKVPHHTQDRTPTAESQPIYHGLPEVDLRLVGEWTQDLYTREAQSDISKSDQIPDKIVLAFKSTKNSQDFLKGILRLNLSNRFSSIDGYRRLTEALFSARKKIRASLLTDNQYTRQAMQLLSVLAEETLYVANILYPTQKFMKFDYAPINLAACHSDGKKRTAVLDGIEICQGDVMLSKGGAGSSSFIARIGDFPGNFSHSTIPYITQNKNEILLIEAEIEDGVKLRSPYKDYIQDKKAKLFVYRARNQKTVAASIVGVDRMIDEVFSRVGKDDPRVVVSYDYDFGMNAAESNKLFCSEVAYYAYNKTKESSLDNPYDQKYWSKVESPARKEFLSRFLNTVLKFPAPSDVELNPNFEIVSMHFDITKFSKDRMMVALIDVVNQIMEENQQEMVAALDKLGNLGSEIATPEDIQKKLGELAKLGVKLPADAASKVSKVPKNISYKQLIFFSFLNEVLAPKTVGILQNEENESLKHHEILELGTMRSLIHQKVEEELRTFAAKIFQVMK